MSSVQFSSVMIPSPPRPTGRARTFLFVSLIASWPVIAGRNLYSIATVLSNGNRRSAMFEMVLTR